MVHQSKSRLIPMVFLGFFVVLFAGLASMPAVWMRATRAEGDVALAQSNIEKMQYDVIAPLHAQAKKLEAEQAIFYQALKVEAPEEAVIQLNSLQSEVQTLRGDLRNALARYEAVKIQLDTDSRKTMLAMDKLRKENRRLQQQSTYSETKVATVIQENAKLRLRLGQNAREQVASNSMWQSVWRYRIDQSVASFAPAEERPTCYYYAPSW